MVVAVVVNVAGTLLGSRTLLGGTAQGNRVLRVRGALLSLRLLLRLAGRRLRGLAGLGRIRAVTAACWTDHMVLNRQESRQL